MNQIFSTSNLIIILFLRVIIFENNNPVSQLQESENSSSILGIAVEMSE